jgi:uncharacterized protein
MDIQNLWAILAYQKDRFIKSSNLILREILRSSEKILESREISVITGVRRCGKSSLLKLIASDLRDKKNIPVSNIFYINFDDPKLYNFPFEQCDLLLQLILEKSHPDFKIYLFIDEIQNLEGWERWLNSLYEFENIKIFITGSNSSLLNSDISRLLTGRNRKYFLLPFSFNEYLTMKNITHRDLFLPEDISLIRQNFIDFTKTGGFPEAVKNNDSDILKSYYEDILYRDIIGRNQITHRRELIELSRFLSANSGCLTSSEKLKNMLGIKSPVTIRSYLQILIDSFLYLQCILFDYSIKRQIYNPPKVYITDTGMSNAVAFNFSNDLGWMIETIVFLELKRRGFEVFYWKSKTGKEVDFLIRNKNILSAAIQVCYDLENEKTREREILSLLEVSNELSITELKIITFNQETTLNLSNQKITVIPVWKWLLGLEI